jgi:hypothetical protein
MKAQVDILHVALIAVVIFMSLVWMNDSYSWRDEKKALTDQLYQADQIIQEQEEVKRNAMIQDGIHINNIDSIQKLQDENDNIKFSHSSIDSIRQLWSEQFGVQ